MYTHIYSGRGERGRHLQQCASGSRSTVGRGEEGVLVWRPYVLNRYSLKQTEGVDTMRCAIQHLGCRGRAAPGGSGRGECMRGAINNRAPHRSPRSRRRCAQIFLWRSHRNANRVVVVCSPPG